MCCGTKRLTEIRCPADCAYLSAAREHPPAVVQRQQERDFDVLRPAVGTLSEQEARLFFLTATIIARFKPDGLQRVLDEDIGDAAAALAATFETAQRGVIYEHRAGSLVAQQLTHELKKAYDEVGAKGGSRFERDAAAVLRALERNVRATASPASPTAYLELLGRIVGPESGPGRTDAERSGLIIPGTA